MKYLILLLFMVSCAPELPKPKSKPVEPPIVTANELYDHEYKVIIIDSCEYLLQNGSTYGGPRFTHKGNCKNH